MALTASSEKDLPQSELVDYRLNDLETSRTMSEPIISRERAQDWISSVINPIVAHLRRELRFLPKGGESRFCLT